ncbi:MAG: FAD-binding oxidoreductase [Rhizobiales bacterium]|nr:FAD-binding oxidoreductase [Hyphomicrobiales bacterium]
MAGGGARSIKAPSAATLKGFAGIVGERYALSDAADMAPYLCEPRDLFHDAAAMVLRPGSVEEVSRVLALAHETGTAIVPQGGNTGLVGGQVPIASGAEVVVSLGRLNKIREIDIATNALIAEAGVVLETIQNAAAEAGRLFPLSLGAEGSCQIGGNLSTNAGGTAVLAYGNARELTLGLEVVLADGRVWNGLKRLRKDNTGYSLKDLFVGAEGTLGLITAAALKLFPRPRTTASAFVALHDPAGAVELLHRMLSAGGGVLTSFELLPRIGLEFVFNHRSQAREPLAQPAPWYGLVELSSTREGEMLTEALEDALAGAAEDGIVIDATIARSLAQARDFWTLRHLVVEVQSDEGGSIKHDVSVPVARIPAFIEQASEAAVSVVPGSRPVPFGHIGDGNIHFNVTQPVGMEKDRYLAHWDEMNAAVHQIVTGMGGSISAEHGIGRIKREALAQSADPVGLEVMRALKQTLDPKGILNPGKVL